MSNRPNDVYPLGKKNPNLPFHPAVPALPELSRWMKTIEGRPAFAVATGAKPSALNAA